MSEALLQTKYSIPRLPTHLVPRQRIDEMMKASLTVPLTLVSAPAGFGKTTATLAAIHSLQEESQIKTAWLSLEENDNEPIRFWRYFAAALQIAVPVIGESIAPTLAMPQSIEMHALLILLLNEIANLHEHFLCVLDDYHFINHHEIHEELSFLLEHTPPSLHMIIVTRADPPLPLCRLRAYGQLIEIRSSNLRFDQAEALLLLRKISALPLNDAEIAGLTAQIEGWAVGLHLVGLALRETKLSGTHTRIDLIQRLTYGSHFMMEYVIGEILHRQLPEIQVFLLQTSILPHFCASLCDAIMQRSDSQKMLDALIQQNLCITTFGVSGSIGVMQSWFCYHHLFADLLREQLEHEQPEIISLLHQRAANWYELHGDIEAAIEYAFVGRDYSRVIRMLDIYAGDMVMEGRALTLEHWQQRLPEQYRHLPPRANIAFAWSFLLRGRYEEMELHLHQAELAISPDNHAIWGEIHAIRAAEFGVLGQSNKALMHAQQAISNISPNNLFAQAQAHTAMAGALRTMGDMDAAIIAYEETIPLCRAARLLLPELLSRAHLSYFYCIQGRLRQAEAITRPAIESPVQHPVSGAVYSGFAKVLLEWNRLDEAEKYIQQAIELIQQGGHNASLVPSYLLLSQLQRTRGNIASAQAFLETASMYAVQGVPVWIEILLVIEQVSFHLEQHATRSAEQILNQHQWDTEPSVRYLQEAFFLLQARIAYQQNRYEQAQMHLAVILNQAEKNAHNGYVIEGLLLQTLVFMAQGNTSEAYHDLHRALVIGEPEGYLQIFLSCGSQITPLLARNGSAYAQKILTAFSQQNRPCAEMALLLPDPLTKREIEVLHLMAHGLTYQQMADELVLSINTIRYHIKSIYSKLQTETRTTAIEKARMLKVI